MVLYVSVEFKGESCNFGEAYKLISLRSAFELDALFSKLPFTHPAFAPYNIFKQASDNVRSGIIIGLGARLQVFQNEMIGNTSDAGNENTEEHRFTDVDSSFWCYKAIMTLADNFILSVSHPIRTAHLTFWLLCFSRSFLYDLCVMRISMEMKANSRYR